MNPRQTSSQSTFSLGSPSWPWSTHSRKTVSSNQIDTPPPRAIFLHEKLTRRQTDRYILCLGLVMVNLGFRVAIWTTQFDEGRSVEIINFKDLIDLQVCGKWIPSTLFGYCKSIMSYFRAIFLTLKLIFVIQIKTPSPLRPKIIFHDLHSTVSVLLKLFTRCKVYYIRNFLANNGPNLMPYHYIRRMSVVRDRYDSPTLLEKMTINWSDQVVVQSNVFAELIQKYCHPIRHQPKTLHPAVDIGLFRTTRGAPLKNILFDPEPNLYILLSVGKYRASTNFELVIDSFYAFMRMMRKERNHPKFRLIIAGNISSYEEGIYYKEMWRHVLQNWRYAAFVTIIRVLPVAHEKRLLKLAKITIHPSVQDAYSEFLLKSMYMGKVIIGTKTGLTSKLLTHRVTGIMAKPNPRDFAKLYREVVRNPHIIRFLNASVKEHFNDNYSFAALTRQTKQMLEEHQIEVKEIGDVGTQETALGDVRPRSKETKNEELLTTGLSYDETLDESDDISCSSMSSSSSYDDTSTS